MHESWEIMFLFKIYFNLKDWASKVMQIVIQYSLSICQVYFHRIEYV